MVWVVDFGGCFIVVVVWFLFVFVVVGVIVFGIYVVWYFQLLVFVFLFGFVVVFCVVMMFWCVGLVVVVGIVVLFLVVGVFSVLCIVVVVLMFDFDLCCVIDWVNVFGCIGVGQFWMVWLFKFYVDDLVSFVQVDYEFNGYVWLVDWYDFDVGEVLFFLEDVQMVFWYFFVLVIFDEVIDCGCYCIFDFGDVGLFFGFLCS